MLIKSLVNIRSILIAFITIMACSLRTTDYMDHSITKTVSEYPLPESYKDNDSISMSKFRIPHGNTKVEQHIEEFKAYKANKDKLRHRRTSVVTAAIAGAATGIPAGPKGAFLGAIIGLIYGLAIPYKK